MYLVTGCGGFIGSNLCHYLMNKDEDVIGLDALKIGSDIRNVHPLKLRWEVININDKNRVREYLSGKDITHIIHLAAQTHVDRSLANSREFWETNVLGTANLMELATQFDIKSFINQITDEAYGPLPTTWAKEGDPFFPTSPYSSSKVSQYYVGKGYYQTTNLPVISTFPVNCFGPRQYPEKIIPKFITKLLNGEKIPLMASTTFMRDWLPVDDMCSALYLLSKQGQFGNDYNIGANNHLTNLDLTHKLIKLCNSSVDQIEIVPDRKDHDCRYAVDSTKLESLGWKVENKFDDYLEQTVNWYKQARS